MIQLTTKKIHILPIIFFVTLLILPWQNAAITTEPSTNPLIISIPLFVDRNNTQGPWDGTTQHPYNHIQDAVDNATAYSNITMRKGIYHETITITKPLQIFGEKKTQTIIDGSYQPVVVSITVDNVTIEGLTIQNSGGYGKNAGIFINSKNNLINNCDFYRTKTGIYLNSSSNTTIISCLFYTNGEGITLRNSTYCNINDSYFTHNGLGLDIQQSKHIKIYDCYASTNGIGFFLNNSEQIDIRRCAAYNNNDNQAGIFLGYCHSILIINSNMQHNGFGIRITSSSSIQLSHCDISWNTHFGIRLEKSIQNIIINSCVT